MFLSSNGTRQFLTAVFARGVESHP